MTQRAACEFAAARATTREGGRWSMRIFKSGVGDVEMMQLAGLPTRGPHSEVQRSHTRAPDGARRLDLLDEVLDAEG